jgi:hypothetical protein
MEVGHRLALDAEQLLDRRLGLAVGALAEVDLEEPQVLVEQVAGRPARVLVDAPQLQVSSATGWRMPSRSTAAATAASSRPGANPGAWTEMTRSPSPA